MTENEVAKHVVDVAYKIHSNYGPGLLESVYEAIMAYELSKRDLKVTRQQPIPLVHEDVRMGVGFRADLIVENSGSRNKIDRSSFSSSQETAAYLSSTHRQTTRPANQL